jgi:hypothetical protein
MYLKNNNRKCKRNYYYIYIELDEEIESSIPPTT